MNSQDADGKPGPGVAADIHTGDEADGGLFAGMENGLTIGEPGEEILFDDPSGTLRPEAAAETVPAAGEGVETLVLDASALVGGPAVPDLIADYGPDDGDVIDLGALLGEPGVGESGAGEPGATPSPAAGPGDAGGHEIPGAIPCLDVHAGVHILYADDDDAGILPPLA